MKKFFTSFLNIFRRSTPPKIKPSIMRILDRYDVGTKKYLKEMIAADRRYGEWD